MTEKYPDIVETLPKVRLDSSSSFIMDAEIVAVNEQGKILPFQTLSNRGRKNVTIENITVQVVGSILANLSCIISLRLINV